jgi:hypothetical protein
MQKWELIPSLSPAMEIGLSFINDPDSWRRMGGKGDGSFKDKLQSLASQRCELFGVTPDNAGGNTKHVL